MCDIWANKCAQAGGSVHLDVLEWMSKAALDIIGVAGALQVLPTEWCVCNPAGFGYEFGALSEFGEPNELADAFEKVFRTNSGGTMRMILHNYFPFLRYITVRPCCS